MVPAERHWQPSPTREGKQPCCSLQLKPGASPEPAALSQDIFQKNTAWYKGPSSGQHQHCQNKEVGLSSPLLAAGRVSKE